MSMPIFFGILLIVYGMYGLITSLFYQRGKAQPKLFGQSKSGTVIWGVIIATFLIASISNEWPTQFIILGALLSLGAEEIGRSKFRKKIYTEESIIIIIVILILCFVANRKGYIKLEGDELTGYLILVPAIVVILYEGYLLLTRSGSAKKKRR